MIPKIVNRKFLLVSLVGAIIILVSFLYYGKSNQDTKVGLGEGPDSGTPKAFSSDNKSSSNSTTEKSENSFNTNSRIKEANDRSAKSKIRSVGTAVSACITSELSNGSSTSTIYSTNDGCADTSYLLTKEYLTENQLTSDITVLTDSGNTKVCVYTLNTNGNGTVSYDSAEGIVTEAGEGRTDCPADQF